MVSQSPQKIPGINDIDDELFVDNTSSSLSDTEMDDEFDRLLNEFLNNELKDVETAPSPTTEPQMSAGLSGSKNKSNEKQSAEHKSQEKISDNNKAKQSSTEFTISEISSDEEPKSYFKLPQSPNEVPSYQSAPTPAPASGPILCSEEQELFNAYGNFRTAINMICNDSGLAEPDFALTAEQLLPRYKPRLAEQIKDELLFGWGIMLMQYPDQLQNLNPNAADDDLLNFAEKTTDELLQMAIISYVEVLIEMESCDIAYESRRIRAKKKRIERQIIEEHEARRQKIAAYIEKIERKKFPINAERLVVNYFKTARKDPDGAYQILVNNPATYAPIETDKIPDRLFGLIKSKPEDGIKINREIGNYMKKLKA